MLDLQTGQNEKFPAPLAEQETNGGNRGTSVEGQEMNSSNPYILWRRIEYADLQTVSVSFQHRSKIQ